MDFSLTPEHEITRRMVREFPEQEVALVIKDHDRAPTVNFHALSLMAELDIQGIRIPARHGGAGVDRICLGLACEELD
jgi:alkylation response protein AidB-like acyl-CoA dehydrogenase